MSGLSLTWISCMVPRWGRDGMVAPWDECAMVWGPPPPEIHSAMILVFIAAAALLVLAYIDSEATP